MRFVYKFKNIFNIIELQDYKHIENYLSNRIILTIVLKKYLETTLKIFEWQLLRFIYSSLAK